MSTATETTQPSLLRVLGPVGATAVVVGSVIGSGIFKKAGGIAENLGRFDLIILVWIVCGVLSLLGALAFAELGAMMPRAGGQYVYLREAFGPLSGFLWGWAEFWIMRTGSTAALAVMFAEAFVESLGVANDSQLKEAWVARGIAIGAIVVLSWVNVIGAKTGGLTQNITTFVKMGLLIGLMALPFLTGTAQTSNLASRLTPAIEQIEGHSSRWMLVAGFAAMSGVFWAYDGWNNIGMVAEEIREPHRNLPIALFFGMFILIALYLGVTVVYHLVLPMDQIAAANAPGSFVASSVCEKMFGQYGASIASAAVMISTFGALNANLFVGPRVIFAMARDRLFLSPMKRIHPRYRTPHVAIIAESAWAVLLILGADLLAGITAPSWINSLPAWLGPPLAASIKEMGEKPLFDTLTDYVVFGQFIFYLLTVLAVFVLRRSRPDLERPYRTTGYPVLPLIFVLGSTGFLIGKLLTSPVDSVIGLLFIGAGVFAYQFRPRDNV